MKLLIFDCDGVLIESEILATQCEVKALNQLGCPVTLEEYIEFAVGYHSVEIEKNLKERFDFEIPNTFWDEMNLCQKELFEKELKTVEGVRGVLQTINIPKCVASNSNAERLHRTLKITKLFSFFEGNIFSAEIVKKKKPEPDIFLYAAEKMGVNPSNCLVIEDSLAGIQAALAAKMAVFAFCGGRHITNRFRSKVAEAGAHQIFERMEDLPALLQQIITEN